MPPVVNIHEAKTHLSRLIEQVAAGGEIIIAKAGRKVARLVPLAADPSQLLTEIEPAGFTLLPVTGHHAAAVALLPALHNDPFDRMLVAQAKTEPLLLLTNDSALPAYGDCVTLVVPPPRRR